MCRLLSVPLFMHHVWLKGMIPEGAIENLAAWARYWTDMEGLHVNRLQTLVWVDQLCLDAMAGLLVDPSTIARGEILSLCREVGVEPTAYLSVDRRIVPLVRYDHNLPCTKMQELRGLSEKLMSTIVLEIDRGIPQVASDLLRMLVMWQCGGIYADISGVCPPSIPFLDMSRVPFVKGLDLQPGYLRHIGGSTITCENGLFFACAQSHAVLDILHSAAKFFDSPDARISWFNKRVSERVNVAAVEVFRNLIALGVTRGEEEMLVELRRLEEGRRVRRLETNPDWKRDLLDELLSQEREKLVKQDIPAQYHGSLLDMTRTNLSAELDLQNIVIDEGRLKAYRIAVIEGNSGEMNRNKPAYIDEYSINLSHSVKMAGYGRYIELVQAPVTERNWVENFTRYFKFEQLSYSWMSPGVSLVETEKARGVRVMKRKLRDVRVTETRREELALSWLGDIVRDYGHLPSPQEIDSWIFWNWPD